VCKHQLAVVAWAHYKAVEPSCTDVTCYWRKSALSCVDLTLHPSQMTPNEIGADLKSAYQGGGSFLDSLKPHIMTMRVPSLLKSQLVNTAHPLDMHVLMHKFCSSRSIADKSCENFKEFVSRAVNTVDPKILLETKVATKAQSKSAVWKLLRYGRITASTLATVAGCGKECTAESLVNKLFCSEKLKTTPAMARGLAIEDLVRSQFCKDTKRKVQEGHFLMHKEYPLFGASPDGIGNDFILEIKSPKENRSVRNYLKVDGTPTKKVMLQILLQLKLCGKKKAFLLIPDENFEQNLKYQSVQVNFDDDSCDPEQLELQALFNSSVRKAEDFFKKYMYYKMIERMRPVIV
jgi:putative phage-type endonuclease